MLLLLTFFYFNSNFIISKFLTFSIWFRNKTNKWPERIWESNLDQTIKLKSILKLGFFLHIFYLNVLNANFITSFEQSGYKNFNNKLSLSIKKTHNLSNSLYIDYPYIDSPYIGSPYIGSPYIDCRILIHDVFELINF